ncbi:MAG: ABC transporter substrate-binding protein [Geobacteraceae bacterium]|nr:ABC transporter substrate-binding protein [Geobacteraceae bacterium]NTW80572.1 ABC transporter substrate-binding protein [Geobacteraceae bacterium]
MRLLLLIILALATLLPSLAQAYDILVLQSSSSSGYAQVLKGFRTNNSASQRVIVMSDYAEVDVVRIVREDRPRLILAVGDTALKAARAVQTIPVVSVMSLATISQRNITGITMFASPEQYCKLFTAMSAKRVGIIHNPGKTGWYLEQARIAAENAGIQLVVREVSTAKETPAELATLAGKVDALWMLPDTTAVTRETTEFYFRFGLEQSIPLISFASSYLGFGAAAVIEIDYTKLGRQAGDITNALLSGSRVSDLPVAYPLGINRADNQAVLKKLGLKFVKP